MSSKSNPERPPAVSRRTVEAPFCMFDSLQKSRSKPKPVRKPTEPLADDTLSPDTQPNDES